MTMYNYCIISNFNVVNNVTMCVFASTSKMCIVANRGWNVKSYVDQAIKI
jgi:hypothetical protein